MLTNCLGECAHLTITVSQIKRDIGRKSSFFHTPLHSTPPLGGFPSEYHYPIWCGKTSMVWLPDGGKMSKISLFVLAQLTNVTDGQTDRHRMPAIAALMHSIARQKYTVGHKNGASFIFINSNSCWLNTTQVQCTVVQLFPNCNAGCNLSCNYLYNLQKLQYFHNCNLPS